jgi:hypothetical protein
MKKLIIFSLLLSGCGQRLDSELMDESNRVCDFNDGLNYIFVTSLESPLVVCNNKAKFRFRDLENNIKH